MKERLEKACFAVQYPDLVWYRRRGRSDERLPWDDADIPATYGVRARPRNLVIPLKSATRGYNLTSVAKLRGVSRVHLPVRGYRRRIRVYTLGRGRPGGM